MFKPKYLLLIVLIVIIQFTATPQSELLPVDPDVTIGTLSNGIKYYIKENKKPENRAELRLIVNAGSALETEAQKGLAHFVEHMAFNGSTHFKKNELIDYLEMIGVKFGPELNAYTSFDETVYMLQVPTDKPELVEKGFLVLEDWAHGLAFDSIEIEKERGVITEEWRLGRGADMRMLDKQFPVLFKDSRYAERLPIGDIDIINSFEHKTLINFYKDWYRPDLIAVAAVGDFDKNAIEKLIKQHFEDIKSPAQIREREIFPVPKHKETLFAIASDKEAVNSVITIYNKLDRVEVNCKPELKNQLIKTLFAGMLNERFFELTKLPDPPFIQAGSRNGRFVRSLDRNILFAVVKDNGIENGLEVLLREARRAKLYGFNQSELDRQKQIFLRNIETQLAEKDKTESSRLIGLFVNNYLNDLPVLSIEQTHSLYNEIIPTITIDDVNKIVDELIMEDNRVILVSVPEKDGMSIPTEKDLKVILENVSKEKITAYEDKTLDIPLVEKIPAKAEIVSERRNEKLDYMEWKLANGVNIIAKQTDFKNDEILMRAFSPGGNSLVEDKDYIAALTSVSILNESGLGKFSQTELIKKLAGKIVRCNPFISNYYEGFNGSCSPNDLETLLQLVYLQFTAPRADSSAFISYKNKILTSLANSDNDPQSAFQDTISTTLTNYNHRSRPISKKLLEEMDMQTSLSFYKDRFADASDFTFIFVGNIDIEKFKPLVQTYLGGLPSLNRNEKYGEKHITYIDGKIEKSLKKGIEPKSSVSVTFVGNMEWNRHNEYKFESLIDVLNIRLREEIREEKGGTYGVRASFRISRIPDNTYTINLSWGCSPDRVEELVKAMYETIDNLKQNGPSAETLAKVKETQRRGRETSSKLNNFWTGVLFNYLLYNEDPEVVLDYNNWIEALTAEDIKEFANELIKEDRYLKVVLYPAEG